MGLLKLKKENLFAGIFLDLVLWAADKQDL